ncbi:hypothetical protein ACGRL8_06830 [Vibrio rumoiensis]|uniref:hypothetical protein n=1 Tax=Vibrio rumoiensis TaxID=76258 RepID=UPI003747D011
MDKKNNDTFHSDDINCCPICSSDEFLLSEDHDLIICVDCGPIPIKNENSLTLMTQRDSHHFKSMTTLH